MRKLLALLLVFIFVNTAFSQRKRKVLLTDMNIQIESTDAVGHLYNFKFDRAIQGFKFLKYRYPTHPMSYFLIGFTYWWKMQADMERITEYDKIFTSYMDSCIMFAEDIYDEDDQNIDAVFFLSAANGFMARIHGERENYARATNYGRKAINFMEEGEKFTEFSSEFLFGLGLYNYYEPWLKENYSYLRPILMFFGDGDKEKGVEQLLEVSKSAFFTRTEAQYFLIDILKDEGKREDAIKIVEYLIETYPDNPVFQKEFAKLCYSKRVYVDKTEGLCIDILDKINKGYEGYNEHIGRYAAYYLGYIYQHYRKDKELAMKYYLKNIEFSEQIPILESNYYHYCLYEIAKMKQEETKFDEASVYFEKIVKLTNKKKKMHKESKKILKENKKRARNG